MSLQAVLGVIVFASVMGIWGGVAISKVIEYDSGTEVTERFNTAILIGIGILVFISLVGSLLLPLFDIPGLEIVIIGIDFIYLVFTGLIVGGLFYIHFMRRKITAESLLLDAGRNVRGVRLLIGGYFILQTGSGLIDALSNREQVLETYSGNFAPALFLFVGLTALLMSSYAKVFFTKEGISLFRLTVIKWEQIQNYFWGQKYKNKVSLILKGGKRVDFSFAHRHREQVEAILEARVKKEAAI